MKSISAGLAAFYASRDYNTAEALIITRQDAQVFGFTSHDRNETVAGVLCKAFPGLSVTNIETADGLAVGNLELSTLHDESVFTIIDIRNDIWKNANFALYRYDWTSPGSGIEPLLAGIIGNAGIRNNVVMFELRDLRQYYQQDVGGVSSKTCRYELGVNDGIHNRCPVNLASYTVSFAITSKTSNQVFTDSARAEADNWFTTGILSFSTGANAGLSQKVRAFAGGQFTLMQPMLLTVNVGDTGTVSAGCLKRREEDCRDKFNVVHDFGGEPDRPTPDTITQLIVSP